MGFLLSARDEGSLTPFHGQSSNRTKRLTCERGRAGPRRDRQRERTQKFSDGRRRGRSSGDDDELFAQIQTAAFEFPGQSFHGGRSLENHDDESRVRQSIGDFLRNRNRRGSVGHDLDGHSSPLPELPGKLPASGLGSRKKNSEAAQRSFRPFAGHRRGVRLPGSKRNAPAFRTNRGRCRASNGREFRAGHSPFKNRQPLTTAGVDERFHPSNRREDNPVERFRPRRFPVDRTAILRSEGAGEGNFEHCDTPVAQPSGQLIASSRFSRQNDERRRTRFRRGPMPGLPPRATTFFERPRHALHCTFSPGNHPFDPRDPAFFIAPPSPAVDDGTANPESVSAIGLSCRS